MQENELVDYVISEIKGLQFGEQLDMVNPDDYIDASRQYVDGTEPIASQDIFKMFLDYACSRIDDEVIRDMVSEEKEALVLGSDYDDLEEVFDGAPLEIDETTGEILMEGFVDDSERAAETSPVYELVEKNDSDTDEAEIHYDGNIKIFQDASEAGTSDDEYELATDAALYSELLARTKLMNQVREERQKRAKADFYKKRNAHRGKPSRFEWRDMAHMMARHDKTVAFEGDNSGNAVTKVAPKTGGKVSIENYYTVEVTPDFDDYADMYPHLEGTENLQQAFEASHLEYDPNRFARYEEKLKRRAERAVIAEAEGQYADYIDYELDVNPE